MLDQDREFVARLRWVRLYEEFSDAGLVCRRFGSSRPRLRKWVRRFEQDGVAGLLSRSRRLGRPHRR
jgi:transposase-like protein